MRHFETENIKYSARFTTHSIPYSTIFDYILRKCHFSSNCRFSCLPLPPIALVNLFSNKFPLNRTIWAQHNDLIHYNFSILSPHFALSPYFPSTFGTQKKTFVESFTLTWIYSHKIMHILWWNDWTKCWLLFCCVVHLYEFIMKYDNYRQPIYLCVHLWSLDGMLVTINLLPVYCILILLLFYIHSAFLRSENDGLMKFTSNHSQPFDCEWKWLCCSFGGLSILYTRICKPEWFEILSERTKNVQFNRK